MFDRAFQLIFQFTLKNKTVIITAGNQGGGAVHALRFAVANASEVIMADKTKVMSKTGVYECTYLLFI